jgi:hypothetical protein
VGNGIGIWKWMALSKRCFDRGGGGRPVANAIAWEDHASLEGQFWLDIVVIITNEV